MLQKIFDSVLFRNEIPVTELPPCLLTELLYNKDIVLQASWDVRKENQLRSIYSTLPSCNFVPLERQSEDAVEKYPQRGLCHQLRHMFSLRDTAISLTWKRNLQLKLAFIQLTNISCSWSQVLQPKQRMFLYMAFLEAASLCGTVS